MGAKNVVTVLMLAAVLALTVGLYAQAGGYSGYNFAVVDGLQRPITDSLTLATYLPGTSTAATVYADESKTSIGTALTSVQTGSFRFYSDQPKLDIRVTNNTTGKVVLYRNVGPSGTVVMSTGTTLNEGTSVVVAIKVVKKTVGAVGVTGTDFNFVTDPGYAAASVDLGAIIPARARVLDVSVVCTTTAAAATTFTGTVGNASSGTQFISGTGAIKTSGDTISIAAAAAPIVAVSTSTQHVWLTGTPDSGTTWAAITTGKWTVLVTYLDVDALK